MTSGENISGSEFSGMHVVVERQWSWCRRQSFFFFFWGGGGGGTTILADKIDGCLRQVL